VRRILVLIGIGAVLGVGALKWRLAWHGTIWVWRGLTADQSPLYGMTTHGKTNRELVNMARRAMDEASHVSLGHRDYPVSWLRMKKWEMVKPSWLRHHPPREIVYEPPAGWWQIKSVDKTLKGKYALAWECFPGCQKGGLRKGWGGPSWYDVTGEQCYNGVLVLIVLNSDLTPHHIYEWQMDFI
jgi:hypothetical protein